jgi:hypothetical protein
VTEIMFFIEKRSDYGNWQTFFKHRGRQAISTTRELKKCRYENAKEMWREN